MVPVHIPAEHHWLLIVIGVINLCLYVYDSAICTTATHRTIFDTFKERFIRNELQWLSDEDETFFQEDNWAKGTPQCPKQRNDTDCGAFTCLFAKQLLFSSGTEPLQSYSQDPRTEMAIDFLNLVSALRSDDLREVFQWMTDCQQASDNGASPKSRLEMEVGNVGLTYHQPPTPGDGNCLFHKMNDKLIRLGRIPCRATKLRSDLVNYLRRNPSTADGTHFSEFISLGAWHTYLRMMAIDGEWGDWIALWGLINMLEIPAAIVSSLGKSGFYPADYQNEAQATGDMALLGHEAELHYHSMEPMASEKPQLALVQELKEKYGEGKITEEICPKCARQFECYTQGVFQSGEGGALQVYSDDSVFCNSCFLEEF